MLSANQYTSEIPVSMKLSNKEM